MENKPQQPPFKTISILGCGWFGLALARKLIGLSYRVKGSTTSPDKMPVLAEAGISPYLINVTANQAAADSSFFDTDVLVICIPPKRSSSELEAYPVKIAAILAEAQKKNTKLVLISSTSVYGDGNKPVNENSETLPDTNSGKVLLQAEQLLQNRYPNDAAIIRFAGLIGPGRNPGRFFAGKTNIPNGLAPVNLIHQRDAVGITISVLEKQAFGEIYNACSPDHPAKMSFYEMAAIESNLETPEFIPEKTSWKIVESLNVPKFLDYKFKVRV